MLFNGCFGCSICLCLGGYFVSLAFCYGLGVVVICFVVWFGVFWGLVYRLLILVLAVASGCCCF